MKLKIAKKIKNVFLVLITLAISNNAIAQCEVGKFPGLNSTRTGGWVGDYILGTLFSGFSAGTVTHIGYKGLGGGGVRRLMLYTNSAGSPGTLVAYTNTFTVGSGQTLVPVVTTTAIPAGDYWIMSNGDGVNYSTDFTTESSNTTTFKYSPYSHLSVPPASASWNSTSGSQDDFYLKYDCIGAALNFDGANDRVNLGNAITSSLLGGTKVAVEAWVKPTSFSGLGVIVGNYQTGAGGNLQILLRRSGSSYYEFWVGNGTNWYNTNSVATPTLNVWQHVAATWNGTLASIYVNGVLSGTTTPALSTLGTAGGGPVWLGGNAINENFTGDIDEVRIWNVARTQCEINTYMNCEISTNAPGLLANYHFNQGFFGLNNTSETSLTDASGNSNTGTLNNFGLTGVTSNWISPSAIVNGFNTSAILAPTIAVNSGSICSGDSFTITPSGASTYTFLNGSSIVTPTSNATYSVIGTSSLGCVSSNTAISSVMLYINNQSLTVSSNSICAGASAIINVQSTEIGVNYTLRDNANNAIIAGPTAGTGSLVAFNTGTISTTTSYNVYAIKAANATTALDFNGAGRVTITGLNISPSVIPVLTAEAWINLSNTAGLQTIIGNDNGGYDRGMTIRDGEYHIFAGMEISTGIIPNTNVWEHVAITWSASSITMYVNGINVFSTTGEINDPGPTDTYISGVYPVSGKIDEVRLWNTARTLSEISSNMNTCLVGNEMGLLAYYKFEDGTGSSILSDLTSNGYDGILSNMNVNTDWVAGTNICGTGGCSLQMTNTPTITVNALPTISVNSGTICAGQSFTMVPTGAVTYTYTSGTDVVMPTADATYSVSGTDANGCVSNVDAVSSVTVNALPSITVNSGTICAGQSFTIVPTGAVTYSYTSGTDVVTPTADATYSVSGTDANGCVSNIDAVSSVTVNALPTITVNSGTICAGQSFTMVPTGAVTYTYTSGTDIVTPTADATYSVSGTDANGCVSNVDAVSSVTVNALPIILAVTNNTLLCVGQTSTLSVTGALTYTWSTTENTTDIVVTPTVQTTYTVDGTDANGCANATTITQDVNDCTGIKTVSNDVSIKIYPNPNNGLFMIELSSSSKVAVTNSLGQVVISETMEAGKHNLDIHDEATGVYFVKVIQQGKQHVIKLIKE